MVDGEEFEGPFRRKMMENWLWRRPKKLLSPRRRSSQPKKAPTALPVGCFREERMKRAQAIIERAVSNGLTEVLVMRFPNSLCTDHGRAINQQEAGWENTLTGLPKELYEFWNRQLRPLGYKIRFQIVDWPGGMPGDVGITLKWA
jgi:hypothetical protein